MASDLVVYGETGHVHPNGGAWVYGPGTRNPQGDFYYHGRYSEPANPTLDRCRRFPAYRLLTDEEARACGVPLSLGPTVDDGL